MPSELRERLVAEAVEIDASEHELDLGDGRQSLGRRRFRFARAALSTRDLLACLSELDVPNRDGVYLFVNDVNHHLGYLPAEGALPLRCTPEREDLPAVGVTWRGAEAAAAALGGRLPTEAEWELAARAGLSGHEWREACAEEGGAEPRELPAPSVETRANAWGIHDVFGNVRQWCADWYVPDLPFPLDRGIEIPPEQQVMKVVRGGSFNRSPLDVRSDERTGKWHLHGGDATGVRVVFDVDPPAPW